MVGWKRSRILFYTIFLAVIFLAIVQSPGAGQECSCEELIDDFQTRLKQGGEALAGFGEGEVQGLRDLVDTFEAMECEGYSGQSAARPLTGSDDLRYVGFLVRCESQPLYVRLVFRDSGACCGVAHVTSESDTEAVTAPVRVWDPPPTYSRKARKAEIEGIVIVQATIDTRGNVTDTKILKDLPKGLGKQAERAVKGWKFRPATFEGVPVAVYYNLTINFTLGRDKFVREDIVPPVRVRTPQPKYTLEAKAAGVEGDVVIQAIIDKHGNVTDTKILKDLPKGLGEQAERAVKEWKFKPAILAGRPVAVYYQVRVNFSL